MSKRSVLIEFTQASTPGFAASAESAGSAAAVRRASPRVSRICSPVPAGSPEGRRRLAASDGCAVGDRRSRRPSLWGSHSDGGTGSRGCRLQVACHPSISVG